MTETIVRTGSRGHYRGDFGAVARGGIANLAGAVVSAVANFALTVVIARYVSTDVAGAFFTVTSLFLIFETVGRLGTTTGLIYFIARWRTRGRFDRIRPGLRIAFVPVLATCCLLAIIIVIFAPEISRWIGVPTGDAVVWLRVLAVVLPFATAYQLAIAATRGFGWMRPTVLVDKVGRATVQLGLVTGVLLLGQRALLGYAWALPYVLGLVVAGWMLRNVLARRAPARSVPRAVTSHPEGSGVGLARRFWAFTAPRAVAGVAQIVLQRLDIVLVAALRGATEAAIYTAATRFLVVGQFINQAITAPVQPQLSSAIAAGDRQGAQALYQVSTAWTVLASWPFFGLTAALAPLYMGLFGQHYGSGVSVVVILSLAMLVASGVGQIDTVIIMAGKSVWNLWTTLLALVVNVAVDLALIPHIGLVGAALGWLASILAANLVPLMIAWSRLDMHPFGANTYRAYVLCGVCFVAAPSLCYLGSGGSALAAVVAAAVGAAGYGAGIWRWRNDFHLDDLRVRRTATRSP